MANPTSAFGWQMPTSTDLVTDLPADFEVFGQAVDTSLADLKGGTSGQILAKASNTDMDFTWVTNDVGDITAVTAGTGISGGGTSGGVTITNSMATAIDAKGDLIGGTGADTFARLAVGTNKGFLQADSTQTTGLKWNYDAWTAWTPTITAASGTFTTVSATGYYLQIGKLVAYSTKITITTNGTAAGAVIFSLPVTATTYQYYGSGREISATGTGLVTETSGGSGAIRTYNNLYPGGNGYVLVTTGIYEVA